MTNHPEERTRRVTTWMHGAALLLLTFGAAIVTRADADLWGHLRFGLDTLRDRQLTSVDPYSFTQDRPWLNHEWLSELQMAWAYRAGGVTGLLMLKAAIVVFVFALAWRAARDVALGPRLILMLMVAMGTVHMTSSVRPQLWTFLCLASMCAVLSAERPAFRWLLPPLFAVWANCHGGWIVGLGVLGTWAVGKAWLSRRDLLEWTALVLACAVATLLNPYGFGLWRFIAGTVRVARPIDEWLPLWTTPVLNWLPWAAGVAAMCWVAWRGSRAMRPAVLCSALLAVGAVRVMRIESLFVVAAAILLTPALAPRWPRPTLARLPVSAAFSVAAASVLVVLCSAAAFAVTRQVTGCVPITGDWAPDLTAMASLRQAGPGRIVTPFNWGEYAIWHLAPRLRVSMDGRRETVYTEGRLREYDDIISGSPNGLAALGVWKAEYVWLPVTSGTTQAWLTTHGYRLDVRTGQSIVAVRSDLPVLPSSSPARSCFPG